MTSFLLCLIISVHSIVPNRGDLSNHNIVSKNKMTISNFAKVDENYYRGGQPKLSDFKKLSSLKVKTIINLRHPFKFNEEGLNKQKKLANSLGMNYINIPMFSFRPPTDDQIDYFFSILNNPNNLPIFVHCYEGKDRTGIMTALYRVKYYHWTYEEAYSEMKFYGYHSILYPEQKLFLRNYTTRTELD